MGGGKKATKPDVNSETPQKAPVKRLGMRISFISSFTSLSHSEPRQEDTTNIKPGEGWSHSTDNRGEEKTKIIKTRRTTTKTAEESEEEEQHPKVETDDCHRVGKKEETEKKQLPRRRQRISSPVTATSASCKMLSPPLPSEDRGTTRSPLADVQPFHTADASSPLGSPRARIDDFLSNFHFPTFFHLLRRTCTCCICYRLLQSPLVLPCAHVFCESCVLHHMEMNRSQCPLCNRVITSRRSCTPLPQLSLLLDDATKWWKRVQELTPQQASTTQEEPEMNKNKKKEDEGNKEEGGARLPMDHGEPRRDFLSSSIEVPSPSISGTSTLSSSQTCGHGAEASDAVTIPATREEQRKVEMDLPTATGTPLRPSPSPCPPVCRASSLFPFSSTTTTTTTAAVLPSSSALHFPEEGNVTRGAHPFCSPPPLKEEEENTIRLSGTSTPHYLSISPTWRRSAFSEQEWTKHRGGSSPPPSFHSSSLPRTTITLPPLRTSRSLTRLLHSEESEKVHCANDEEGEGRQEGSSLKIEEGEPFSSCPFHFNMVPADTEETKEHEVKQEAEKREEDNKVPTRRKARAQQEYWCVRVNLAKPNRKHFPPSSLSPTTEAQPSSVVRIPSGATTSTVWWVELVPPLPFGASSLPPDVWSTSTLAAPLPKRMNGATEKNTCWEDGTTNPIAEGTASPVSTVTPMVLLDDSQPAWTSVCRSSPMLHRAPWWECWWAGECVLCGLSLLDRTRVQSYVASLLTPERRAITECSPTLLEELTLTSLGNFLGPVWGLQMGRERRVRRPPCGSLHSCAGVDSLKATPPALPSSHTTDFVSKGEAGEIETEEEREEREVIVPAHQNCLVWAGWLHYSFFVNDDAVEPLKEETHPEKEEQKNTNDTSLLGSLPPPPIPLSVALQRLKVQLLPRQGSRSTPPTNLTCPAFTGMDASLGSPSCGFIGERLQWEENEFHCVFQPSSTSHTTTTATVIPAAPLAYSSPPLRTRVPPASSEEEKEHHAPRIPKEKLREHTLTSRREEDDTLRPPLSDGAKLALEGYYLLRVTPLLSYYYKPEHFIAPEASDGEGTGASCHTSDSKRTTLLSPARCEDGDRKTAEMGTRSRRTTTPKQRRRKRAREEEEEEEGALTEATARQPHPQWATGTSSTAWARLRQLAHEVWAHCDAITVDHTEKSSSFHPAETSEEEDDHSIVSPIIAGRILVPPPLPCVEHSVPVDGLGGHRTASPPPSRCCFLCGQGQKGWRGEEAILSAVPLKERASRCSTRDRHERRSDPVFDRSHHLVYQPVSPFLSTCGLRPCHAHSKMSTSSTSRSRGKKSEARSLSSSSCGRFVHFPCAWLAGARACVIYGVEQASESLWSYHREEMQRRRNLRQWYPSPSTAVTPQTNPAPHSWHEEEKEEDIMTLGGRDAKSRCNALCKKVCAAPQEGKPEKRGRREKGATIEAHRVQCAVTPPVVFSKEKKLFSVTQDPIEVWCGACRR